ncbi:MAG: hypothetical protein P8Z79_21260 [Sedimentisphaerales bacterium]
MSKNEKMSQPQQSSRTTARRATLVRAKELIGTDVKSIEPRSMSAEHNMRAMGNRENLRRSGAPKRSAQSKI